MDNIFLEVATFEDFAVAVLQTGVSLETSYWWFTTVFVVTNLPLTASKCGLIFTQTLIVTATLTLTNSGTYIKSY